ncbi:iron-containing alcohol dehydrogenase [Gracilinema caldarium]|uniref:iron-containing alcohol dehydrogenase n=1 Tax=Gracilinema caldarium TaxID=215591 RepID=UPI0026EBD87B|nr:iron-containing alcohol dehydrogenase [Gracilinema caldarium]
MIGAIASPTKIIETPCFSAEGLDEALVYCTASAGSEPVLCIVDPRPFPLRDRALADLNRLWKLQILDQVVPNPTSADIMDMAAKARRERPAAVIGIGGGSTLDSAKAVAMLLDSPGDLDEYLGPEAPLKPQERKVPLILIPTTTGTGSEVTRFGVYTARSGRKYTLNSPVLQAEAAILSPDLVADLPPPLVAATGYDALTHALETLWNKNATALSDRLALEASAAVLASLEPAWRASVAREAERERHKERPQPEAGGGTGAAPASKEASALADLQRAATLAGIAFNKTGTAAIHALSFILSEEWHLSHGAACAFFTQNIFDLNMGDPAVRGKFLILAKRVYQEAHQEANAGGRPESPTSRLSDEAYIQYLRDRLVELKYLMGLPDRFSDIPGFTGAAGPDGSVDREAVAALFDKAQSDFKLKNNPVPCTQDLVRQLVREKLS